MICIMEKTIYCIRHGYALHNKLFWDIGRRAYNEYRDTPLLEEGYEQAKNLSSSWNELKNVELVVVSPCHRTLETACFVFKNKNIPFIAKDFLIEYPIGGYENCNRRKDISDLKYKYPFINFEITDNVLNWSKRKETILELENRIEEMVCWIGKRKENHIAIVTHSSFLGQFKDKKIGDEKYELKHCYPYKIKLKYDINQKYISMKKII